MEKSGLKNPPFPYGFLWPGWPGAKIHKIHWEAPQAIKNLATLPLGIFSVKIHWQGRPSKPPRLKLTTGKMGGFAAQIFSRALPKEFWTTKCWLENPQSSLWFPLAWVVWGPKLSKYIGRPKENHRENGVISPDFPPKLFTGNFGRKDLDPFFPEVFGESSGKKTMFPMISFGLGGLKPQIPKIYGEGAPPGHQATQAKGNHRENWGFSTHIFSQSSFQGPWGKIRAEIFFNPKVLRESSVEKPGLTNPPFSLWFPLAWVAWGQNSQNSLHLGIFSQNPLERAADLR